MKKLKKEFLPIIIYSIMIIFLIIIFWLKEEACGLGFGIITYYVIFPISIFCISMMNFRKSISRKKYLWSLYFGLSVMLFEYLTFNLGNMLAFNKINMPSVSMFLIYSVISLVGLLISSIKKIKW